MATHTCNQNCGCTNTYVVTPPCPPACPEVFNSQCIVYTGTDIMCNADTVIKRYDYLDTVITKLVNYICNTVGPVTQVVGSTYIDVVPNTVGNVTTYTVSVDIPQLDVYFANAFQNDLFASILAGPGIAVATNAITGTVTISHQDTSAVNNLNSDNSGNTFIQDIAFAFDTFGHVTGASVVAVSVTPPNDFDRATVNPDVGFTWGPANDPTNIQIAEAPGDTLNFVAGTGITLNGSTVPGTDAIRITNSAPDQTVVLTEGAGIDVTGTYPNFTVTNTDLGSAVTLGFTGSGQSIVNDGVGPALVTKTITAGTGISVTSNATDVFITNTAPDVTVTLSSAGGAQSLVNDGTGPTLATKGLSAGKGIALSSSATDVTIAAAVAKYATPSIAAGSTVTFGHGLNTTDLVVSVRGGASGLDGVAFGGTGFTYSIIDPTQMTITNNTAFSIYATIIG